VIIGNSSSDIIKQSILEVAGCEIHTAYDIELQNNPNSPIITTPPGDLLCKAIFFLKWQPTNDEVTLRQSIVDLIWTVFQDAIAYNFTSIAFPTIGYESFGCNIDILIRTMVKEMKIQLIKTDLPLTIKFVVKSNQDTIYNEFCKQVLTTQEGNVKLFLLEIISVLSYGNEFCD